MEACASAHYWARRIEELGHVVVLLPPQYVRPYVVRNKTDRTDVDALLEAFRNEQIRPVPIKTVTQQVLGTLHRLRSGWLRDRTRAINSLRGLLRELGFFIPEGGKHVLPDAWEIIQDPKRGLPDALMPSMSSLCQDIVSHSTRIEEIEAQLEALAKQVPVVARLRSVPGIGLLTATALYAFIGDVSRFPSGRHMASFVGLTPREYSSGLRRRLGRISKRGDVYLRMLLIHGARSVLWHAKRKLTHTRCSTKHSDGETGRTGTGRADNKPGLRGRFHRLAPCARIPSWPRVAQSDPDKEAVDTFAVRPLRHLDSSNNQHPRSSMN